MQRLMREVQAYVRDLSATAVAAWDAFFFRAADPLPLGLIRIGVGLLLCWNVAVLGLDLNDFLGAGGWISPAAIQQYHGEHTPGAWSIWFWTSDRWLFPVWFACLVVTALFALGSSSRLTAVLAWIVAVSIDRRAPVAAFGFDHMISTWVLYLAAFGASGQAVSLDRWLATRRRARCDETDADHRLARKPPSPAAPPSATVSANLSLRMIQLHLALVYGSAGLSKLMGPEWWNGTAMEMLLLTPEFKRWDLSRLLAHPLLLNFATHCGLALEIGYPVLIWSRKLRPLVLLGVVSMHLGIDLLLGLTEFGLVMVVANLAFVPGSWLRNLTASNPTATAAPAPRAAQRVDLVRALQR